MITLSQLEKNISDAQKSKKDYGFQADKYIVRVEFSDKTYLSIILEELRSLIPRDKNQRLNYYITKNANAIGYIYSTLAYNKQQEIIVQRWLDNNINISQILSAINDLLQHADILTEN